jgi:hypothetical protein
MASSSATRPDPNNIQAAAGNAGLINDQDSVGTFGSKAGAGRCPSDPSAQAELVTGAPIPLLPCVLPETTTASGATSVDSRGTRSSITQSLVSRISQMEATLAKVDKLDLLMNKIVSMM